MSIPTRGTSVVICTYNGGSRIERVLRALIQQVGSRPFEVILIDNRSTDGVGAIANDYWAREGRDDVPFRVVREDKQGLSYARRRGAMDAQHELVLFCDDDNLLCPTYVEEAARLMDDPRFVAVGGPGIPIFEADPPSFIFERIGYWACGDRYGPSDEIGAEHVIVSDNEPRNLFGAGLAVRRRDILALFEIPDFPILTDRSGAALSGGNDCEICFMLMIAGGKLLYSDKLRFGHIIPAGRLTLDYFKRLVEGGKPSREYWRRLIDIYVASRGDLPIATPQAFARAGRTLLTGRGDRRALFRFLYKLRIFFFMNQTERTAIRMARRAKSIKLALPLKPHPVTLCTTTELAPVRNSPRAKKTKALNSTDRVRI